MEKRRNFSSFPQYFQYISNLKSPITYKFVKCGCQIIFSSILQFWYVDIRISRSISESPLEFHITRVDFIVLFVICNVNKRPQELIQSDPHEAPPTTKGKTDQYKMNRQQSELATLSEKKVGTLLPDVNWIYNQFTYNVHVIIKRKNIRKWNFT